MIMQKKFISLLAMLFLAFILITPVSAADSETDTSRYISQLADAAGAGELTDAVPENAKKLMSDAEIDTLSPKELVSSPGKFLSMIWQQLKEQAVKPLHTFGTVLGTLILCALLDCTRETFVGEKLHQVFSSAAVLFLTASVIFPASDCISDCVSTVESCSDFVAVFAPIYGSVVTASGLPITGSIYNLFLFSAAQIVSMLVSNYLVPLVGVYLALSIAGALSPQLQLEPLLNSLKSFVCWALGFLLAGFVALLTMQSSVSSSMDALTLKTSKMLISSFVPIVGGALSEAVSTAGGCLKIVKSAFGVYGIAAAVCTFLPILLRTAVWYGTLTLGAAIGEMLSVKAAPELLKAGAVLMGILIAILCLYMLLILVSTTILLLTGAGLA